MELMKDDVGQISADALTGLEAEAGGDEGDEGVEDTQAAQELMTRRPQVAESRKYRKRAQAAERSLVEVRQQLTDIQKQLDERDQTIREMLTQQTIDEELRRVGALNIEQTRPMVMARLSGGPADVRTIQTTVETVLQAHPQMFRRPPRSSGVMSAKCSDSESRDARIDLAAERARDTGHLHDVLRYQQIKRRVLR
ncbi:MAG TPA: hypothetical protein VG711_01055 [Phycisphaerales bacterium]|nr:hypothetical protein [Phycisphaerales bacterium]